MADTIPTVLPRYIDKSVYYELLDTKKEGKVYVAGSYSIKSTFKGILRLSPNDANSLYEKTDVQITDFSANPLSYRDSINEFLDVSESQQMIKLSTSDGEFVDMRLNMLDVEVDNLYINGVFSGKTNEHFVHKHNNTVLMFSETANDSAFTLGNVTTMPTYPNKQPFAPDTTEEDPLDEIKPVKFKYTVNEGRDNSGILYAKDIDGKRVFKYENASELIEELILEAMMNFHTIPTGSIHFVPVTFEQYMSLVKKGESNNGHLPNVVSSLKIDTSGSSEINTYDDPIVRDYLLCDGRKYYIKDFPELAKMLHGENISYERLYDVGEKDPNLVWRRFEYKNEYSEDKTWFRVPDLRHQFIRSPYMSTKEDPTHNDTGRWNPDNIPLKPDGKYEDDHYHFIALAEYNADATNLNFQSVTTSLAIKEKREANNTNEIEDSPGSLGMVLNGAPFNVNVKEDDGDRYDIFSTCNATGRCAGGKENHNPAVHFFTMPKGMSNEEKEIEGKDYGLIKLQKADKDKEYIPDSGVTSTNIIDVSVPTNKNELDFGAYTGRVNDSYCEFNTDDMVGDDKVRYGMENNPEFFACVPLIRI